MFIPFFFSYSEALCYNAVCGLRSQDELGSDSRHFPTPELLRALGKVTESL